MLVDQVITHQTLEHSKKCVNA